MHNSAYIWTNQNLNAMKRSLLILILLTIMTGVKAQQEQDLLVPSSLRNQDQALVKLLLPGWYDFGMIKMIGIFRYDDNYSYKEPSLSFSYRTMMLTVRTKLLSQKDGSISVDKQQIKLTKEQADALYSLFTAAVCSSSYLNDVMILDGTPHVFVAYPYVAEINPYHEGTNGYRLCELTDVLFESVKTKNPKLIDDNMKTIKELTDRFIALYPCKPSSSSAIHYHHVRNQVKGNSMGLEY